ncbi:MAG: 30S ribosomal protein S5 [Candidatus Dojkabacteria bacterium]|nr:30S ribosomal protein S5 [Candidatus Dojkabacteria bacterium]MDQ7021373.1 30S ribosomal protein S5 [Candidatus Dojkabacteria bacterium]
MSDKPTEKEEKKTTPEVKSESVESKSTSSTSSTSYSQQRRNTKKVRQRKFKDKNKGDKNQDKFETKIIKIRRVTRMFKGGRRMRLSVFVAIGDKNGNVGIGLGRGADVRSAQSKAVTNAKKKLISVERKGKTIPHDIFYKKGAAKILMKPASPGTGVVAGSSMRIIAELAGIDDLLGKIQGTNNAISNAYATIEALNELRGKKL